MTDSKVIITLVDPSVQETQFVFDHPQICIVGRENNCDISLPTDPAHRQLSRHHCLLDIDPPAVKVRDLHSKNGTFVNGERCPDAEEEAGVNLKDGDEIRVAHSLLRVRIEKEAEHLQAATRAPLQTGFEPVFWVPGA